MKVYNCENFMLRETLYSGQFFNFKEISLNEFVISNSNFVFYVKQEGSLLFYDGIDENSLITFFGLDFDLSKLDENEDIYFRKAFERFGGLRILKVDLFLTIISFICSAAANQGKIEKNIRLISQSFGRYDEKFDYYFFPRPSEIDEYEKLIKCSVGYRAKYILETGKYISNNKDFLDELYVSDYKKAKQLLVRLPGVGSKVADCICLFALNHYEAFPVDTWIKKMIKSWYGYESNSQKDLEDFIQKKFGSLGGYYQQYLFHLLRKEGL